MRRLLFLLFLTLVCAWPVAAGANSIDFESLSTGTIVNNQYVALGVTFSGGGMILTAGINLNEFDFPPHSGVNVIGDVSGPLTLAFAQPVPLVSALFTYSSALTLTAYGANGQLLGNVNSLFSSNFTSSGNGSPNELIQFASTAGIARVTIIGSQSGSSFVMDDLTFGRPTTVPEPSSEELLLEATGVTGAIGVITLWKRRRVQSTNVLGR